MQEADSRSGGLLKRLSNTRRQALRKNVHILFLGLNPAESDPIISLLRGARMAPRGRQVVDEQSLLAALGERSWDLVICSAGRAETLLKQSLHHLKRLEKDIPVIQLVPHADSRFLLQGLKHGVTAVVPLEEKELLLLILRRELDNLENRRRMRRAESLINEAERRCLQLMRHSNLPILYTDGVKLLTANATFTALLGYEEPKRLEGRSLESFFSPEDKDKLQEILQSFGSGKGEQDNTVTTTQADGAPLPARLELQETRFNGHACIQVAMLTDKQPVVASAATAYSEQDPLTGLYNADFLDRRLSESVQAALIGGHDCCLLYLKLDQQERLLAKHGREAYDTLCRDLADLLTARLNPVHIKARLDEQSFVVLFHDPNPDTAVAAAEELRADIAKHITKVADTKLKTTVSIGIVTVTDTAPSGDELIVRARETAEKVGSNRQDGNGVLLYEPPKALLAEDAGAEAIKNVKNAFAQGRMKILFQPIVPLSYTSKVSHYEAFVRMLDKEGNPVEPSMFLDNIELADLSNKMDRWVIDKGIATLREELNEGEKHRLFISLSSDAWEDAELLPWLSGKLRENRIPADHLVFQISESDCSRHMKQAQHFVNNLKKIHCLTCIKHYGSSSNAQQVLRQISADYVKLDGAFINDLADASAQDETFETLVDSLKSQGKITIAPMVEDPKIMGRLWKSGVGMIQGYYLQPPTEKMDYDFFDQ